jgi:hypothetical protein
MQEQESVCRRSILDGLLDSFLIECIIEKKKVELVLYGKGEE